MKRWPSLSFAIVCCVLAGFVPLAAQSSTTYDKLTGIKDLEARRQQFISLSPQEKSLVMRTHVRRHRDAMGSILTFEQRQFMDRVLNALGPEMYSQPLDPEQARLRSDLSQEAARLFTRHEGATFFTLDVLPGQE